MRRLTVRTRQQMVRAHRQERYFLYSSGLESSSSSSTLRTSGLAILQCSEFNSVFPAIIN